MLRPEDRSEHEGIPCTTPARTLLDLAATLNARELERSIEQAEVQRLFDLHDLNAVVGAANGHHGTGPLRRALGSWAEVAVTMSELEERFLALSRTAGIPQPEVNAWLSLNDGAIKPDLLWRAERLVVELDGHASHGTRNAFERDRLRDRRLTLAGFRVVRFTWRHLTEDPAEVVSTLRRLLPR
ncbi:MAG TPA: DUF559 domain-containing protein [Thermoleophilaceae bacterium]|nr:DUF559 domain-containing protein [Thermoleophilaceae bacterium]